MANPQTENGYTKIANELLDAMCQLYLSGNQWKVLHAIIRKTYGWNKKVDWITATQIAQMTGIHAPHVSTALHELRRRNIILREGRLIAVQKDYDQWQMTASCNFPVVTRTSKLQEPVTKRTRTSTKSVQEPVRTKERKTPIQKKGSAKSSKKGLKRKTKSAAVEKFRGITGRYPNRTQIATIDERVTNMELWVDCIFEWNLRGYKPTNVKGMLDWYRKGGPPQSGPRGKRDNAATSRANNAEAARRLKEMGL